MAEVDLEKTQQELRQRFAAPLPEFYQRRIIFWYDPDKSFEDQVGELVLDGVKILILTGSNTFAAKKLLCEDDLTSDYLVYDPRSFSSDDDNWLINVQLYSEEYRTDQVSMWIDQMELPATPIIRNQIKYYRKFFNNQERRKAFKNLKGDITTATQMQLGIMAVLSGCDDLRPDMIIKSVIKAGLDQEENPVYQSFITYGADKPFWIMISQGIGYHNEDNASLSDLTIHILLTAATRTMYADLLAGLEKYISTPHQAFCYDFVSDWMRSSDNMQLYEIARFVEDEVRLMSRFSRLSVREIMATECFPCVNECILTALMKDINNNIIQADVIRSTVEKRRTMSWYDTVSSYYEGLLQVANMQSFYLEHSSGFHTVEPQKIWKHYTADYYKMDSYYRLFHLAFGRCLKKSDPLLDDHFKLVVEKVEGLYSHWFLGELGQCWSTAAEDNLEKYGRILEIPQQTEFYDSKVSKSDSRIFVIISDAFRYELAQSLSEQLQREMQCKVNLDNNQAIFPTVTKFGMAALLPHKNLSLVLRSNGTLGILSDGQSTEAGNRDKVLKAANSDSIALKYDNIIGMKRAERSALVKGMQVVYIYHDKIDVSSHTSDSAVFPACDEAIAEIKNLIRIIVNEFGGTNVIVTADHGFLFTNSPLKEDDKVDKTTPSEQDIEIDRRYMITRKGVKPDYMIPVLLMDGKTEYDSFAPRENIRIKKKGGGLKFVHGGISLQEMVVPVLEFQYLRNAYKSYQKNKAKIDTKPVEISLLSANRKISNMIFSLSFYQKEAVGGNRETANYILYFVDSENQKISDTCKIIADKTTDNAQERTFRCSFNLKSRNYNVQESYYLIIADESGLQAPIKEEFQIDIAFAVDEYNFFQ